MLGESGHLRICEDIQLHTHAWRDDIGQRCLDQFEHDERLSRRKREHDIACGVGSTCRQCREHAHEGRDPDAAGNEEHFRVVLGKNELSVDADDAKNRDLATKYGVSSYPTLKFFGRGAEAKAEPEAYTGGRTEKDFVEFLNEKCGTQRAVGGGLTDLAGRLPSLDALAAKFLSSAADLRSSVYDEAKALAETLGAAAKPYLKVMEKVANSSEEYLAKERKR